MLVVKYVGPLDELKGKQALAQRDPFRVQFDGYKEEWRVPEEFRLKHPETGVFLGRDWHEFPEEHFEVVE